MKVVITLGTKSHDQVVVPETRRGPRSAFLPHEALQLSTTDKSPEAFTKAMRQNPHEAPKSSGSLRP